MGAACRSSPLRSGSPSGVLERLAPVVLSGDQVLLRRADVRTRQRIVGESETQLVAEDVRPAFAHGVALALVQRPDRRQPMGNVEMVAAKYVHANELTAGGVAKGLLCARVAFQAAR